MIELSTKHPDETRENYLVGEMSLHLRADRNPYNEWVDIVNKVLYENHMKEILELNYGNEYVELDTEFLYLRKDKYKEMVSELFHPDEIKDGEMDENEINQELEWEIWDLEKTIEDRVFDLIEWEAEKREQEELEEE